MGVGGRGHAFGEVIDECFVDAYGERGHLMCAARTTWYSGGPVDESERREGWG